MTEVNDAPAPTEDRIAQMLDQFAEGFSHMARSPLLHSPAEHGLEYADVTFPSRDGVPLEGWFIPAAGRREGVGWPPRAAPAALARRVQRLKKGGVRR